MSGEAWDLANEAASRAGVRIVALDGPGDVDLVNEVIRTVWGEQHLPMVAVGGQRLAAIGRVAPPLPSQRPSGGPRREPQIHHQEQPGPSPGNQREREPRAENPPKHLGLADLLEPQQVGVQPGQGEQQPDEDEQARRDHKGPRARWAAEHRHPKPLRCDHRAAPMGRLRSLP